MNLNDFVEYIDQTIYLRGYDYYENDYVTSVKENAPNLFAAEVEGTETYSVEVELDESLNIVETSCDCPYDWGEHCKHQVAVFLALRDIKLNGAEKTKENLPSAKKNSDTNIEDILLSSTKEDIVKFLLNIASENEEIKQRILLRFDEADDEKEIYQAVALIQMYVLNNSDKHGFVDYRSTSDAIYGAELVVNKADSAWRKGKTVHAMNLALCVIQEMVDLLQDADDSDGQIGGIIEREFNFITEIIENTDLGPTEKNIIFENLIKEASHGRYDGWTDWKLNFIEACSLISDTPDFRDRLEKHMELLLKKEDIGSWGGSYFEEKVNQIRYNIILQNDSEQKAHEFIEQNLRFPSFRKISIGRALQKKDYEQVIRLAIEGETRDSDKRGLVNGWRKYRYDANKILGRIEEQRGVAMDFILDGSFEFYKELKNTYDTDTWSEVYPKIIFLLENQKKYYSDVYTRILIEEDEKEKLLEYIKKSPASIESHYRHLIPGFENEVYDLFLKHIEQTALRAANRKDYQGVCAIIRNLKKAGGKEQASEVKDRLLTKYTNKPAFRDELSRV